MLIVYGIIIGFATLKIVDAIRHMVPWSLANTTKDVIVIVLSLIVAIIFVPTFKTAVFVGLGAGGIASMLHKLHNLMELSGDSIKVEVLEKAQRSSSRNRR